MKVVFDTNIYISGFLFKGGIPSQLLELARDKKFQLFVSPEILEELRRVLKTKFELSLQEVDRLVRWIEEAATLVYPQKELTLIKRCLPDNRILECAAEAKANFLVTGDKEHLLSFKETLPFQIISPAHFYQEL